MMRHHRGAVVLLLMVVPAVAWGADRAPMPPPSAEQRTAARHQPEGARPPSASEAQAIDEAIAGADVRAYTRQDGTHITEYARHGRVYMIKVKPPGNLPAYYLFDEHGNGQFSRRLPGGSRHLAPPQWVVKEF